MAVRRATSFLIAWLTAACAPRGGVPIIAETGAPPIGFLVDEGADATRPFGSESARPLRVGVWYPAARTEGPPMSLEEYKRRLTTSWASAPTIHAGRLPGPMLARLGAPPAAALTPLVLYLPGFGANATVHALACERLARHGYTVAAMASMRSTPAGMSFDLEGVEAQRRDAEWGLAAVEKALRRRFTSIGLVGVSFGSLAGWRLLTGGDERMIALVSLDGSLGFVDGAELMAKSPPERPARQAVLHMNTLGNGYNDLSLLESQPFGLVQVLTFAGFEHNQFFPGQLLRSEPTGEEAALARARFDDVLDVATRFLDAQFAGRRACVAPGRGTSACLAPRMEVPAESAVSRMLATEAGRAEILALGRRARALGLDMPVAREGLLEAVGDGAGAPTELAIARLRAELFPRSYRAQWALGEALGGAGDFAGAIAAFEAVKAINPRVRDADDEIDKLRRRLGP
jgi:hypothetical protein